MKELKNCKPIPRDELIEAYITGTSLDVLRKRYGVSVHRLWRILERRGVPRRNPKQAKAEMDRQARAKPLADNVMGVSIEELKAAYVQGCSSAELSRRHGITSSTINRHLRLHGVRVRSVGESIKAANVKIPREVRHERAAKLRGCKKSAGKAPGAPGEAEILGPFLLSTQQASDKTVEVTFTRKGHGMKATIHAVDALPGPIESLRLH